MRRRDLIAAVAGVVLAPFSAARAQQEMPTVGALMVVKESDLVTQARLKGLREGLAALGWIEGKNIRIVYRWAAGDMSRIEGYAKELVALKPSVIIANGTPVVEALKKATTTIPIVAVLVIDPVGLGFVKSLARPGGNITGFSFINAELIGKWRELLSEAAPDAKRAELLFDPKVNPQYFGFLRDQGPAPAGAPVIEGIGADTMEGVEAALSAMGQRGDSSLIIGPDAFMVGHVKEIAALALKERLPAISVYREFAAEGGLMSYGPDVPDIFRRAADYVDRILKGANPAELPVQQPVKFEFVINAKTAAALGLTIPPMMLAGADEVIE